METIFEVDQFCKVFFSKLLQGHEFTSLTMKSCQPMFIEKFLFKISEQMSDNMTKFELLEVNIEQVEHALT